MQGTTDEASIPTKENVINDQILGIGMRRKVAKRARPLLLAAAAEKSSSALTKDKIVWAEEVSKGNGTNSIKDTRFDIGENRTRDIASFYSFTEIHISTLELIRVVSNVGSIASDTAIGGHDLRDSREKNIHRE
jgi:hypothetical protein